MNFVYAYLHSQKKSDDQNVFIWSVKNRGQEFGHCTWHYDDENENERKNNWSSLKKIGIVIFCKFDLEYLWKMKYLI